MMLLLIVVVCIAFGLFAHNCALSSQNAHLRKKLDQAAAALIRARAPKAGRQIGRRLAPLDSGFDRPSAPRGGAQ